MLEVGEGLALPPPKAGEVLVRIQATSVNPIDCMRRGGYGRKLLGVVGAARLPLVLGQDVAGEVVQIAEGGLLKEGDKVWGALPPTSCGSYATHTLCRADWLQPMPESLSFAQAAVLPYAALTAYAALADLRLDERSAQGRRVLVQGGSGGVGSFCVQLLAAWGAEVTTLSSAANLDFCRKLGAHEMLDYAKLADQWPEGARAMQGFDAVLAAFGMEEDPWFEPRLLAPGGSYTTLRHPLLEWSDRYGILPGSLAAGGHYLRQRLDWGRRARRYRWSLFRSDGMAMEQLGEAVSAKAVRPVSEHSFPLEQIAEAHELSETGRVRGKIAISLR